MDDKNLHADLTNLLFRLKKSNILEFIEKNMGDKSVFPNERLAKESIENAKGAILRLEIYLSNKI